MKLVEMEAMPREERAIQMIKITRVLLAAIAYDEVSSTPQKDNEALYRARTELHDAVENWKGNAC